MPPCSRDDAVTAVVGAVLVLTITVAGILVALAMGTPTVQDLQDRSALNTVVGQLEAARQAGNALTLVGESRSTSLALPAGVATLGPGSHFLVTWRNTTCTLTVTNWADWDTASDSAVTLTTGGAGCGNQRVFDVTGGASAADLGASGTLAVGDYESDRDYLFQVNSTTNPNVPIAQAWLLHTERLQWQRNDALAALEAGAVFARDEAGIYRVAGPRVEDGGGASLAFSLPTLQDSVSASFPAGDHAFYQQLDARVVRVNQPAVFEVRVAVHGNLAEAWCGAFQLRNSGLSGASYSPCAVASDGVRTLTFSRTGGTAFPFLFGQPILHGRLQV